jgi:hypothetical protein
MNLFEDNRAILISKINQDKGEFFSSPIIKSKTPVPKKLSKETLKPQKKHMMKKLNTPKAEKALKSNTNGLRESSKYFKRAKNKGSVSVELFNNSKELQRPHSVISKSFFNHLELAQKVNAIKKYSNQLNIERIIKKSLLKAKSTKLNKEKDQKHNQIQNEIRKQELKFQNNQIRLQNFQKTKKKTRKRSKKSGNSGKFLESFPKNNKSESMTSYPRDYLNKVQEMYSKDRGKNDVDHFDDHLARKPSIDEISDIQANDMSFESDGQRQFSFIRTENAKIKQKENFSGDGQLSKSLDLSLQRNEEIPELHISQQNLHQKKTQSLSFQTQSSLKITKIPVILSTCTFSLFIPRVQKVKLEVNEQCQINIPASPSVLSLSSHPVIFFKAFASISQHPGLSISSTSKLSTQHLNDLVSEGLSSDLSNLFLLEQLKLFELSTLADVSKAFHSDLHKSLTFQIEKKFSSLISLLHPEIEKRRNLFISSLSKDQNNEFLAKTQKKKQTLHSFLNDLRISEEFVNKIKGKEDISGSSSSSDERTQGISHSRSVIRLHEGFFETSEMNSAEIDFGYTQSPPEPVVPSLKIDLKPIENEASDTKRVLNSDVMIKFAEKVLKSLDFHGILEKLRKPLEKNPLDELDKIQDLQIGSFTDTEIFQFDDIFNAEESLKIEVFEQNSEYRDQETLKIEMVYKRLIVDSVNYLVQQFRPFGFRGKPLPWGKNCFLQLKPKSYEQIFSKILQDIKILSLFSIGKHEELDPETFTNENSILKYKEKQLDRVIYAEVLSEEDKWLDYEFEETQVKIDLADIILYELVTEVININE